MVQMNLFINGNRVTDVGEKKLMVTKGEREGKNKLGDCG